MSSAPPYSSLVSHLECTETRESHPASHLASTSRAGAPLAVRYRLDAIKSSVDRDVLRSRPPGMWRYREWLPLSRELSGVSLGEPETPLVSLDAVEDGRRVWIKDEGRMPTGSFKARGLAISVSMARGFGVKRITMPSAGNAGAALAAYASRAGIESFVYCPRDAPEVSLRQIVAYGARLRLVDGLIGECAERARRENKELDAFECSTLREPYRVEGKKTMGFELADQMNWSLPDFIFYPTGGGTGLIGMWKAFDELERSGIIGAHRPRMVAVQSVGCAPLVRAFDEGRDDVDRPWAPVETRIHGVRVPKPFGGFLSLRVLRESDGFGSMVDDDETYRLRASLASENGLLLCPEGAACLLAYRNELRRGRVKESDRVVLFNCADGSKTDLPEREAEGDSARDGMIRR